MENPLLLFYFRFFKSFVFFPLSLEEFSAKRLQREHSQPVENHMFDSKSSKLSAQRAEEKGEKKEERESSTNRKSSVFKKALTFAILSFLLLSVVFFSLKNVGPFRETIGRFVRRDSETPAASSALGIRIL